MELEVSDTFHDIVRMAKQVNSAVKDLTLSHAQVNQLIEAALSFN